MARQVGPPTSELVEVARPPLPASTVAEVPVAALPDGALNVTEMVAGSRPSCNELTSTRPDERPPLATRALSDAPDASRASTDAMSAAVQQPDSSTPVISLRGSGATPPTDQVKVVAPVGGVGEVRLTVYGPAAWAWVGTTRVATRARARTIRARRTGPPEATWGFGTAVGGMLDRQTVPGVAGTGWPVG